CASVSLWFLTSACHNNVVRNEDPEPGVPLTLATQRAEAIDNLSYTLSFTIPSEATEPISGHAVVRFATKDITRPLVLDFRPGADHIQSISVAGRLSNYRLVQDHIIIPKEEIASEENVVEIAFRA